MLYALLDRSNEVEAETFCSPLKNNGYNNNLIKQAPVFARLPPARPPNTLMSFPP